MGGVLAFSEHCSINWKLLPVKAFCFMFFAGVGSLLPFMAMYMKQLGLTSSETAIIYGVMPFLGVLVRPLVGAMADRWRQHKLFLVVCTLLTAVLHLLILLVPARESPASLKVRGEVLLRCDLSGSVLALCSEREESLGDRDGLRVPADSSECSVPWEEYVGIFSSAERVDDVVSVERSGNATGLSSVIDNLTSVNSKCDISCFYATSARSRQFSGPSERSVCFVKRLNSTQNRCQVLADHRQFPVTFSMTVVPDSFSQLQQNDSHDSCEHVLFLLDLDLMGDSYDGITCTFPETMQCAMTCSGPSVSAICESDTVKLDVTFGWLMVVNFFASASFTPVFSLADAIIFDQLGSQHYKYGQQRMWGTLGLALSAVTITFVIQSRRDVTYDVMFYLFAALCSLSAAVVFRVQVSSQVRCQKPVKNACRLLTIPRVIVFLGVVLYVGMVGGAIEGFLFWYLADLGGGPLLFGLCLAVNCAFEIPFFFFSGAILKRLKSMTCLYASMLVLSLRLLTYSLLRDPWHVLFAEALHGVTFGIMWAAVTNHANEIAPPGMSASVQGLVGGMNFGLGKGLGSLITGVLFSVVGERWTFATLAMTCVVILVTYAVLNTLLFTGQSHGRPNGPLAGQSSGQIAVSKKEQDSGLCVASS